MRIYYDTGEIYEGDPMEAPTFGVQVIVENVGNRTLQHSLRDYYGWDGKMWEASNRKQDRWLVTLEGKLIETQKFKDIRLEALNWLSQQ